VCLHIKAVFGLLKPLKGTGDIFTTVFERHVNSLMSVCVFIRSRVHTVCLLQHCVCVCVFLRHSVDREPVLRLLVARRCVFLS